MMISLKNGIWEPVACGDAKVAEEMPAANDGGDVLLRIPATGRAQFGYEGREFSVMLTGREIAELYWQATNALNMRKFARQAAPTLQPLPPLPSAWPLPHAS